jgi:uncharacterized protein (TIGR04255 family)
MTGVGSLPQGNPPLPVQPLPHIIGLQFCDRMPDIEASRILFIQQDYLSTVYKKYDCWETTAPDVCDELSKVLTITESHAVELTLTYHDAFIDIREIASDVSESPPSESWEQYELFDKACRYLPSNALEQAEPWHSSHGYYLSTDEGLLLVNINIQKQKVSSTRDAITLTTLFKAEFSEIDNSKLQDKFDILHKYLKKTTRNVLSKNVGKAIGLLD